MIVHVDEADFRDLLNELKHLREQVQTLQARSTASLIERRAERAGRTSLSGQVAAFMHLFDQPRLEKPGAPDDKWTRLRVELVVEEAIEFVDACFPMSMESIEMIRGALLTVVRTHEVRVDLPAAADALADIDYVVEGARLTFGINGGPVADEVHRSNIAKVGGPIDPTTGKKLKPSGWTPPDIERVLREQGWEP